MTDAAALPMSDADGGSRHAMLALSSLYLDPDNGRLSRQRADESLAGSHVTDESVQRRLLRQFLGAHGEHVGDIVASLLQNGWQDIEPIIVRKLSTQRYLVVEGNRRVAALKHLEPRRREPAEALGQLDPAIFDKVPCIIIRENLDGPERLVDLLRHMSSSDFDRLATLVTRLDAPSWRGNPETASVSDQPWRIHSDPTGSSFSLVDIKQYRGLAGLSLKDLGRVNLIVGINNAGKTSVLEAIYLLANQTDPRALLELLRRRTRIDPVASPTFAVTQLPSLVLLGAQAGTGSAGAVTLDIDLLDRPEDKNEDWAAYLRTLRIVVKHGSETRSSMTDFFAGRSRRTRLTGEPRWLSSSVFHSPFSLSDPELLVRCNEESIKWKLKDRVVEFIRTHIDPDLRDVALANEHRRFLVTHDSFPEAVDLSSFGEGLQRVFLTGLLFAGARGGVVLIDEFENALHTSLLIAFTKFVHELAVEFGCQVFLTTHSKETVDAFLLNGYRIDEIVSYLLKRGDDGQQAVVRIGGSDLKRAVEVGDVDLRRM
ncbi:AAA family ATPase [Roseateles sp. L2-2]|uniref:AAA family ATPase n=1 Tax=Roseateles sp. L2-2 TaxID=3422597 RepID=UPI003D35A5DA